jgi:hypothetical protein
MVNNNSHPSQNNGDPAPIAAGEQGESRMPIRPTFRPSSNLLDFKSPWPCPLADPDSFSGCLDNAARDGADRLGQFVFDFIPLRKRLPKPSREVQDFAMRDWHFLLRRFQGIATFYQPKSATEFRRRRAIVPAAPQLLRLEEMLAAQEKQALAIPAESWSAVPPMVGLAYLRFYDHEFVVAPATGGTQVTLLEEIRATRDALARISSIFGAPQVWVKQPKLSTCRAIRAAFLSGEQDFEVFLAWFRDHELELRGNELDAGLAQVLLGMRMRGSKVMVAGDLMVPRRRAAEISLADVPETELYDQLMDAARITFRNYAYDGRADSNGKFVGERCYEDPLYSERAAIEFPSANDVASARVSAEPEIGIEYEDWDAILRSAGLSPSRRRALILRKNGEITSRESPGEWKRGERAIHSRRAELVSAIAAGRKKRVVKAPQISAANNSGVVRDRGGFVLALAACDDPIESTRPNARPPKWFELNPPPISANVRKTKQLFKKVSTPAGIL